MKVKNIRVIPFPLLKIKYQAFLTFGKKFPKCFKSIFFIAIEKCLLPFFFAKSELLFIKK